MDWILIQQYFNSLTERPVLKANWIALHFITTTIQFKSSPKEVPGHEIFLKNQSIIIINY